MQIYGINGSDRADVSSLFRLKVELPTSATTAANLGFVALACAPNQKALQTFGPLGRLAVGVQTLELFDPIDGAAINANIWNQAATTMVIAQSGTTGFMVLNNTALTAINTSCQITSIKPVQLINTFVPTLRVLFKTPNLPQANATMELGFLEATGTAPPTNGAFLRWSAASEFRCVTAFNSVEAQSASLTAPAANSVHALSVTFRGTKVEFWLNDPATPTAEVSNPLGNPAPTATSRIYVGARVYTGSTIPVLAPELHIAAVSLFRNDLNGNKLWPSQMVSIGRGSYQSPITPFAQTANHANSTSPASAALSNTAAGYTTLGGRYQFAAPAGAATDFALFAFQVPAGFQLFVTDFRFDAMNIGAAVATTATIMDIGVGLNASAVSLATADSYPTNVYAPRRIPLGTLGWVAGDAIGADGRGSPVSIDLMTPWLVDSNRFFHVIAQVHVGTATAGQIIRGCCYAGGYLE